MEQTAPTTRLVLYFVATSLLWKCEAQRVFHIGLVGDSDSMQLASLNYAIEKMNANTSNQGQKSFTLQIANSSQHLGPYQHAVQLLAQDVVALIGGSDSFDSACVLSMFTQIPLIRHHGNHGDWDECQDVGVSLSANHDSYSRATVELLKTFHWSAVTILYEGGFTRVAHLQCQTFTHQNKIAVEMLKIYRLPKETAEDSVARTIKRLSTLNARVVLLHTSEFHQRMLISERRCGGPSSYVWIIQGEVASGLVHPHDMIIGFRLPRVRDQDWGDYEARLQPSAKGDNIYQLKDGVVLSYDAGLVISWMVNETLHTASLINKTSLLLHLKKVQLQGFTGSIQFNSDGSRDSVNLDVMNLQNDSLVKVGSWNKSKLLLARKLSHNDEHARPSSLEGKLLRIVTVEGPPFVMKTNGSKYEGFCIDILDRLARELKFTYEIGPSTDGNFGAEIDGVWNGMIGDLVRKKADMAVSGLTVTKLRESVVDFSVAYMRSSSDMILKKKTVEDIDYLQFMLPFQFLVWVMVLVCLLVVTVATFTLNYYSPYGHKDDEGRGTSPEFNLFNSLWFSLACMLQQGGDNTPKSTSGRLLVGVYWFGVLILVSTYTANLAAFLTLKHQTLPVNNLEEAFEAGYDITVTMSSADYDFFRNSQSEFYQKIWKHMTSKKTFCQNGEDGLAKVRSGKYVYVTDGPYLEYLAGQEPCDLMTLPALSKDDALGFALQEGDPHMEAVNYEMLLMRRTGFLARMYQKWWEGGSKCPDFSSYVRQKQVNLKMMAGVYIVLTVGVLVSFAVLGGEIIWHKRRQEQIKSTMTEPEVAGGMPEVAE